MANVKPTPPATAPALDSSMAIALVAVGAVSLLGALIAAFAVGWSMALGVAFGGLVATLNLWIFAQVVRGVLSGGSRSKLWGVLGGLKFVALLALVWALLQSGVVDGMPLALGYAALPLGIALATVLAPRSEHVPDPAQAAGDLTGDLVTPARPVATNPTDDSGLTEEAAS